MSLSGCPWIISASSGPTDVSMNIVAKFWVHNFIPIVQRMQIHYGLTSKISWPGYAEVRCLYLRQLMMEASKLLEGLHCDRAVAGGG